MKQDVNYPFTMQFLIERYEVRRQSLLEYTKNHISELNEDGVHARKFGKEWRFDEVAVSRLDELRGYLGASVATNNYETAEVARIKELEQELEEAKAEIARQKEWLDSQALAAKKQLALLEAHETKIKELEPKVLQLNAAEADNKLKADKIAELQADGERKDQAISNLQAEKEEQKTEIKKLEEDKAKAEATVAKYKNMNFVGRFKYLFGFGKDE